MNRIGRLLIRLSLIGVLLWNAFPSTAHSNVQVQSPEAKAKVLLDSLSPAEKVGQLFLVSFKGTSVDPNTPIYNLITNYHIGGVILSAANDNFSQADKLLETTITLTTNLQNIDWIQTQTPLTNTTTTPTPASHFIPLFIGISQEGGGAPNDQILNGLTPLPDAMALGATWSPQLSQQVGSVLGKELSDIGFNLLLAPSLDVLETPRPEGSIDLGTRSFGGDPFWVSTLGTAYIQGIHEGSQGKMAVVPKNFPGNGGSDRPPEFEVATVRKSLEQLKNFDLMPFFAVTGNASSPETRADALLAAHIRYQGFQENIRTTTRPISLDPEAFNILMSLPALASWRENGGIVICDNLGSPSVKKFYQLNNQKFDGRLVTLNAFLAGNDILYLGNITSDDDPDSFTTISRIIEFFRQKYQEDPAFAQRVDQSVLRILTLKYRLYPEFNIETIQPSISAISEIGTHQQITLDVARQAATLISPRPEELASELPNPPRLSDQLVIFTDVRLAQQCSQCPPQPIISVDALSETIKKLYGSQGSGQIWPSNIKSYSFEDLLLLLNKNPTAPPIESSIKSATWIIFAMLNISKDVPNSQAIQRFLAERPDLFQQKKLIVFAFGAPYYLDATDISKLSAYYDLYSTSPVFIETAARLLFHEIIPQGALPVSVPGIGYDLITATSPDPSQTITLAIDTSINETPSTLQTTTPQPTPVFKVGDLLPVRTGQILDHNGHIVPDGTPVQFIINASGELVSLPQPITTVGGIARALIKITSSGIWEIRAESEPAKQSDIIRLEIPKEEVQLITIITPTEIATPTETPPPSPTAETTAEVTPIASTIPHPNVVDWLTALIISAIVGFASYRIALFIGQIRAGVQGGLSSIIGGLLAYSYLALQLPGSITLLKKLGTFGVIVFTLFGAILGVGCVWLIRTIKNRQQFHT